MKFLGGRGASAVMGLFMLALGSSEAGAQTMTQAQALVTPAVLTTAQPGPAQTVTTVLPPAIDREAAWLHRAGWPLYALVNKYSAGAPLSQEANCIATAVYFEARGESVEGQLAVARVIMNRAASGKYPASWCSVVTQPWQFSFVNPHSGQMPSVDPSSSAWATAQGVTRVALTNVVPSLSNDVLWYHANYVAPSWGRRLNMAQRIGAHIFYRS